MYTPIKLKNFKLYELVSTEVMALLGSNAWGLFNANFVQDVDRLVTDLKRDTTCKSVVVNDWYWGGGYSQSGFREFNSTVGAHKSQHKQGNALDLKFVGISKEEALDYLITNKDRYSAIKRYENLEYTTNNNKYGGWLHLDGKLDELELRGFNP